MDQYSLISSPLRSLLNVGESMLWEGKPNKRKFIMRGSWYLIPFSLFFAAFSIFWESTVLVAGAPVFFKVWGIPFVLVGLYLVFGRYWVAAREADNTFYAITNNRILMQTGAFRNNLTEISMSSLPYLQLSQSPSGNGTVYFRIAGALRVLHGSGLAAWWHLPPYSGFLAHR